MQALLDQLPELAEVPDSAPPYDCAEHGIACQETAAPMPVRVFPPEPRTATAGSGEACAGTLWPRQFAQAIVETLAGLRPFRQLAGWCTDQAQARILALAPLLRTDRQPAIVRVLASQPTMD